MYRYAITLLIFSFLLTAPAWGANKYWVGGTGTWNASATTNWSDSDGGSAGATAPSSSDTANVTTRSGDGTITIASGAVANSLIVNWTTVKTNAISLSANFTIAGTLTLNGNSTINRILVRSSVLGTPRTITTSGATVTATNTDFRDIALSVTKDLSAQTDIGDAGGNSGITFPASTTQTLTGNTANWSTASWTSRVPLPQDAVVISLTAGQTLTADMPRLGRNISFTTATNFTLGNAVTSYGSLDFTGAGTFGGSYGWTFESGVRTGTIYLTSGSKTFVNNTVTIQPVGATLQLADNFSNGTNTISFLAGTFDSNGYSVATSRTPTSGFATGATVIMGNSTWTLSQSGATTSWVSPLGTLDAGTSTIVLLASSTAARTFDGGGKNYNNIVVNTGAYGQTITGANTFNTITVNKPKTITFPASTITTVNHFVADGDGSNQITINSSTGGTPATLRSTSSNALTYVTLQDINATGGTWKCLTGCNNTSGNTGVNFTWTDRARTNNARLNNYKKF